MRKLKSGLLIFLMLGSILTLVVAKPETITSEWTSDPALIHKDGHFSNDPSGTATYLMYDTDDGTRYFFRLDKEKLTVKNGGTAILYPPKKWMTNFDGADEWTTYAGTTSITTDTDGVTCSSKAKISNIDGKPDVEGESFTVPDRFHYYIKCTAEDSFNENSYSITVNTKACAWDDTSVANNGCNFADVTKTFSKTFTVLYLRDNRAPKIVDLPVSKGGFDDVVNEGAKLDIFWADHFQNSRYEDDDLDDMKKLKIIGSGSYGDLFFGVSKSTSSWTTLTSTDFTTGVYYQTDSNHPDFNTNDVLTEKFDFQVFDGESWSLTGEFKIKINNVEDAPYWNSIPKTTVAEDTVYSYDATAIDPEGDLITYSVSSCPDWLDYCRQSMHGHLELSGIPRNDDVGHHNVVLSVSDDTGKTTLQDFTIEVINRNDAPTTTVNEARQDIKDGSSITFDFDDYFTDADGDDLTYTKANPCESINPNVIEKKGSLSSNLKTYTANDEESGYDWFCINADDGNSGAKILMFRMNIGNTNDVPTSADDYVDIQEGTSKIFSSSDFTFEDLDGNYISGIIVDPTSIKNGELRKGTLTNYEVISRGSSSFETQINTISNLVYVPNPNFAGEDRFKFKVVDSSTEKAASVKYEMTIFIKDINDKPIISPISSEITNEDTPVTINILAEDIEDKLRDLTLTATSSNENLVKVLPEDIKSKSGLFEVEINPKENQHGSAQIIFKVTDSEGATDTEAFQLTVEPVNDKPTSQDSEITIERSETIVFDQSYFPFEDVEDQQTTTIRLIGYPEAITGRVYFKNKLASIGLELNPSEIGELVFKSQNTGTETIDYILRDSNGEATESHSITINIEESSFGANSQLCEQGGLRILNSDYCCRGGYIPKPDLFDVSLTGGDIDACISYTNQPPKAIIIVPDTNVTVNDTITFDGSTSRDPDGIIVNYLWNFGDGSEDLTGETVTHKMESDCTVTACDITLTVTDNFDNTDETSIQLLLAELNETNESTITIIPEEELEEEEPEQLSTPEPESEEEPDYSAYDYGFDDEEPEKGGSMAWVILILIAALVGGAIFLWKKGGTTKKEPEQDFTSSISEPEQPRPISDDKKEHMDKFISEQKGQGQSNEEIRQKLLGKGWNDEEVDKHMNTSRE